MVKFLIIRFSSIGDIVLTTPVIRILKQQVEGSIIHYLTKQDFDYILQDNPYVDKVHLFTGDLNATIRELREEQFDYIIDLHRSTRSSVVKTRLKRFYFNVNKLNFRKWLYVNLRINRLPELHIVDRYLDTTKVFDCKNDQKGLDYFIPSDQVVDTGKLNEAFSDRYIALAIGAQHFTKKMPVEKLTELIRLINLPVIILGGPEDKPIGEAITSSLSQMMIFNGSGQFTVNQSASIIKQSSLVITHDTGMMHIAAAFRKKILSLWGSTVPEFGMYPYLPDPGSKVFQVENLSCRPCSKIGHNKCPKGHFRCMMDQDLEGIARDAQRLYSL